MPLVAPLGTTQSSLVTTMPFPPMWSPSSAQLLVLASYATVSGDLGPRGCQSNIFLYYSISQNSRFTISLLPRVRRSLPECKWTFFYLHLECLAIKNNIYIYYIILYHIIYNIYIYMYIYIYMSWRKKCAHWLGRFTFCFKLLISSWTNS